MTAIGQTGKWITALLRNSKVALPAEVSLFGRVFVEAYP